MTGGRILPKITEQYTSVYKNKGRGLGVDSFPRLQGSTQVYKTKEREGDWGSNPFQNYRAVHKCTRPRAGDWGSNPSRNCRAVHLSTQDQGKGTRGRILPETAGQYTQVHKTKTEGDRGSNPSQHCRELHKSTRPREGDWGPNPSQDCKAAHTMEGGMGVEFFPRLHSSAHKRTRPREGDSSQQDQEMGEIGSQQRGERNGPFTRWRDGC